MKFELDWIKLKSAVNDPSSSTYEGRFRSKRRVKRPLLDRVSSLAKFLDNLTEITCVKEWVTEFFFTEAVNTVM